MGVAINYFAVRRYPTEFVTTVCSFLVWIHSAMRVVYTETLYVLSLLNSIVKFIISKNCTSAQSFT